MILKDILLYLLLLMIFVVLLIYKLQYRYNNNTSIENIKDSKTHRSILVDDSYTLLLLNMS